MYQGMHARLFHLKRRSSMQSFHLSTGYATQHRRLLRCTQYPTNGCQVKCRSLLIILFVERFILDRSHNRTDYKSMSVLYCMSALHSMVLPCISLHCVAFCGILLYFTAPNTTSPFTPPTPSSIILLHVIIYNIATISVFSPPTDFV